MSVTIRDVAAAAGVSTATVSKVINHSPTISQETVERVQEVIHQMGYRPNKRAQSFARRATKNILFLSELEHSVGFENPHLFEMLAGAEAALARKDYGLLIKRINSRELVNSFADIMDSEYVDGAIVHASVVSKEVAALLTDTSFPYVVIGMPDFANRLCWIDTNNNVAGQIAASHLRKRAMNALRILGGQRRIRFLFIGWMAFWIHWEQQPRQVISVMVPPAVKQVFGVPWNCWHLVRSHRQLYVPTSILLLAV